MQHCFQQLWKNQAGHLLAECDHAALAAEEERCYVTILINDRSYAVIQISSNAGVNRRDNRLSASKSAFYALRTFFDGRKVARV